ncbi:UTRA domain-containing protein [Streptomyces sp. NPDC007945]|uniref:UTRA domain-containing protein n=1 Tax=Streptomyces sp. NPDC007945 TaxID=3364797 RepID=UPI0036EE3B33
MTGDAWIGETAPYLAPREPGQSDAWTDEAARRGRRGGQRLLRAGEVDAPDVVRAALGLSLGERVVVRRRLILLDDVPVELADSYYPPLHRRRHGPGGADRRRNAHGGGPHGHAGRPAPQVPAVRGRTGRCRGRVRFLTGRAPLV